MSSIKSLNIEEYLERLASRSATPGGGAAAALTSAQGAALVMMVANLTIGKPEYAEFEELNKDVLSEAEVLLKSLTDGADNDADAFGKVSAAYALPKDDENRADIYVAALCLYAGIKSAKVNVDANLKVIWKADPYNAHLMDCRASDVLTDATLIITELSHSRNSEKQTEE